MINESLKSAVARNIGAEPPHDEWAEGELCASLLWRPEQRAELLARVPDSAYYLPAYRRIAEAIRKAHVAEAPITPATIGHAVLSSCGGDAQHPDMQAVDDIAQREPTAGTWAAERVLDAALLRDTTQAALRIAREAETASPAQARELLAGLQETLAAIAGRDAKAPETDPNDSFFMSIERDRARPAGTLPGVTTGIRGIDKLLGGWRPGTENIIAARTAIGKTALAGGMAVAAAESGVSTLFLSLEMPDVEVRARILASMARVDLGRIIQRRYALNEGDLGSLYHAGARLRNLPLRIVARSATRPSDLRALVDKHRPGLVIVDYLQYMHSDGQTRGAQERVTEVAQALKRLAMDAKIPIVALAQINRQVESRDDHRPTLADLRDSGAIEMEADSILMLYRPDVYRRHPDGLHPIDVPAELAVAKNRMGHLGTVPLLFRRNWAAYEALEPDWRPAA